MDLAGEHRRVHLVSDNAQLIVPSPDERWVAFTERFNSYVATLPLTGQPVQIGPGTSDFPVKRITRDAGMYLHWSPDSKTVSWSLGPEFFSRTLSKTFAFAGSATDTVLEDPDTSRHLHRLPSQVRCPGRDGRSDRCHRHHHERR